jgi:DNA-binding NtrC family response regulator
VEQAMREAGGNKERAAETLQVSYKTLLQKLREYGVES